MLPALDKIRAAGFEVAIAPNDGGLLVRPADRLTDAQRAWLKANRAALLAALAAEADPHLAELIALFDASVLSIQSEKPPCRRFKGHS